MIIVSMEKVLKIAILMIIYQLFIYLIMTNFLELFNLLVIQEILSEYLCYQMIV